MTLTIEIDRLRLRAFHGVMDQERSAGNIFEVSLRLTCSASDEVLRSDDPATMIDYSVAADIVKTEMAIPSALLENVAWRIRRALLSRYPMITAGIVKVAKLTPPMNAEVAHAAAELRW